MVEFFIMGRRRQPLILERTAEVLSTFNKKIVGTETDLFKAYTSPPRIKLQAGLLTLHDQCFLELFGAHHALLDGADIVGLSVSTLKRLCLRSGSWVMVKHVHTRVGRPARVVVLDPPSRLLDCKKENGDVALGCNDYGMCFLPSVALQSIMTPNLSGDVAYMSPMLAFNLGLHITWIQLWLSCHCNKNLCSNGVKKSCLGPSYLELSKVDVCSLWQSLPPPSDCSPEHMSEGKENIEQSPLKFAFHVRIGHVKVPVSGISQFAIEDMQYLSEERQEDVDTALQDYFKCSRVLARGDLFAVRVPFDAKKHCKVISSMGEDHIIFFKVMAMEPESEPFLWVNCNQTALVLGNSVPSQLPPLLHMHNLDTRPTAWMVPVIDQLARLIAPSLHPNAPSLNLRTAVLLCGPAGCGKRTVVKYAAKELGIHVVEYNCYELLGPSEGKTAAALIQAFEVARRYAPAVLLLRRFGALGKNPTAGPPSDGAGGVSRVGTVLRESIHYNLNTATDEATVVLPEDACVRQEQFMLRFEGHKPGLVLVVAAAESTEALTPPLRRCFTHELTMKSPDEQQRSELIHQFLHPSSQCKIALSHEESYEKECQLERVAKTIASQTAGTVPRDLQAIVADAGASMVLKTLDNNGEREHLNEVTCEGSLQCWGKKEGKKSCEIRSQRDESVDNFSQTIQEPIELSVADVEKAFERFKSRMASGLGAPKVPNVKWEDVGGLEDVKKAILDTVQLPLVHRDLFASGLRQRSGVLLYGPPGTGKTLLAKAVATECSLNFLSVKGPELINMYIGESEKNVREIFQKARAARPCVIFFDELDALAPARGASGDSGGVMDRVVSQMLAEIDGLNEGQQDLFIIGASNRPDLIDPALLRPGRFDKLLYVGISTDTSYRQRVLEALTRKFKLDEDVSLEAIARICPVTFTGADMYALCADAWMHAVKCKVFVEEANVGAELNSDSEAIVVKHEDFTEALRELTPSLSEVELSRYERLRAQFEGQKASPSPSMQKLSSMNDLD